MKNILAFTTFTAVTFIGTASFGQIDKLNECLELTEDQQRLECYDAAMGQVDDRAELSSEANETAATIESESKWDFNERADEFTDNNTSFIALTSDSISRRGDDPPMFLVLRCDGQGGYDIYMIFDGYIGSNNDSIPVRYRFDGEEAVVERWSESTDGTAAFLPKRFNDFRSGLLTGTDFAFEVTDFRGSTSAARFENSIDANFEFITKGCVTP